MVNLLCFRSPKRRRSRSSSRSRRSRHRRSSSRSREHRWRSRSHSRDRSEREKDRERRQKGLPSIKSQTLSGMCYSRNKCANVVYDTSQITQNCCNHYYMHVTIKYLPCWQEPLWFHKWYLRTVNVLVCLSNPLMVTYTKKCLSKLPAPATKFIYFFV